MSQEKNFFVVGSINADLIAYGNPASPGNNYVVGRKFEFNLGGKSLNVAYSLKSLNSQVDLISRVGNDLFGDEILRRLFESGFDISKITVDQEAYTGIGHVRVGTDGEYNTIVIPGASMNVGVEDFIRQTTGNAAGYVILNFEIQKDSFVKIAEKAKSLGLEVIANLSPTCPWAGDVVSYVDVAVMNYLEALALCPGENDLDLEGLASAICAQGAGAVVITLGKNGVCGRDKFGNYFLISTEPVQVLNAVGAGDSFLATMAYAISKGIDIEQSAKIANLAGRQVCLQAESFLTKQDAALIMNEISNLTARTEINNG